MSTTEQPAEPRGNAPLVYAVSGMSCDHCRSAIETSVGAVPGVAAVEVDLAAKTVTVHADPTLDPDVRAAIDDAGYDIDDIDP